MTTWAGRWTRATTDLRDAFRAHLKPGRPRRGYRSRAHLSGTAPVDARLARASARTAGPRRRRHP